MTVRFRFILGLVSLLLPFTACGGTSFKSDAASCESRQGKVLTEADWAKACTINGAIQITLNYKCKDGSTLYWDNYGYGLSNSKYIKHANAPADTAPPRDVVNKCLN